MKRFGPVSMAFAALAVLPTVGCSSVFGDDVRENFHQVVPAAQTLQVSNAVGTVELDAWNKSTIEIDAVKRGSSVDDVRAIAIHVQPQGSTLVINTDFSGSSSNRKVEYTIHAPARTNLDIDESVGAIKSTGFTANVREHAGTGAIETAMAAAGGAQRIVLDTSVGAIKLTLPASANAKVTASASVGGVKSDFPLDVSTTTVGANANGSIGSGSATIDLSVATGGIRILRE